MESAKKVLKWLGIFFLIIVGATIILFICLNIIPGMTLFGYRMSKSGSSNWITKNYVISDTPEDIVIITETFDIEIIENQSTNILTVSYYDNTSGLVTLDYSQLKYKQDDNLVVIEMLEKEGWIFGSGKVKLEIPESLNVSLNINSTSGDISINKELINNLTIDTESGSFTWKAENITYVPKGTNSNSLRTDLSGEQPTDDDINNDNTNNDDNTSSDDNSDVNEDNNDQNTPEAEPEYEKVVTPIKDVSINSLNIFTDNASVDLSCFENIDIHDQLLIKASKLKLNLKNLSGKITIDSTDLEFSASNISNEENSIKINSRKGVITIGTIEGSGNASFVTEESNITITNAYCNIHTSTNEGNTRIDNAFGNIIAYSAAGGISINKAWSDVQTTTDSGDISISEYYKNAYITTNTGNFTGHSKSEESTEIKTIITQKNGNITLVNENNSVEINCENACNVNVTFRNMPLNKLFRHTISNTKGDNKISILVTRNPFKFRAVGDNVYGELAENVKISSNKEYIDYLPNNYESDGPLVDVTRLNIEGKNIRFIGLYE